MQTDGIYYFNRCRRCNALLTKLRVKASLETGKEVCSCGASMFGPTNPIGLEWASPAVLKMCLYKILGWLAPPPDDGLVPPVPASVRYQRVASLSNAEVRVPEEGEK